MCENGNPDKSGLAGQAVLAGAVGLFIGLMHLLFMLANIAYMIHNSEGRWHMFWIICGYIDFPVSLLLSKVILPFFAPFFHTHGPVYGSQV